MPKGERVTCPVCNGHGFTILAEAYDSVRVRGAWREVLVDQQRRAPTDAEAELDLSDLSPVACKNRCFFGTVVLSGDK
jgi:hypothetical protein